MKHKFLSAYFALYILITSTSIILLQNSIYSSKTTEQLTHKKVCLIVIDGLRYDGVASMDFLSSITSTNQGILYKAKSLMPSKSRPGYERILTGTETEINGVVSNKFFLPSLTPNLFSITKESGLSSFASGFFWLYQLYPLSIENGRYYFLRDGSTFKWSEEKLRNEKPDFMIIHPMDVDWNGHKFGGNSIQYKKAAAAIDKDIKEIYELLSNENYTIIVTSDHGHLDSGGHGDGSLSSTTVPLAIIDKNLRDLNPVQSYDGANLTDIAPTICDILGLPKSIYMTGDSLISNNGEINKIRTLFSSNSKMDFNAYFRLSSIFTQIILSIYIVLFISSCFIIINIK